MPVIGTGRDQAGNHFGPGAYGGCGTRPGITEASLNVRAVGVTTNNAGGNADDATELPDQTPPNQGTGSIATGYSNAAGG